MRTFARLTAFLVALAISMGIGFGVALLEKRFPGWFGVIVALGFYGWFVWRETEWEKREGWL